VSSTREAAGNLTKRREAVKRAHGGSKGKRRVLSFDQLLGILDHFVDDVRPQIVAFREHRNGRAASELVGIGQYTKFNSDVLI
jgi:hypothetical protein